MCCYLGLKMICTIKTEEKFLENKIEKLEEKIMTNTYTIDNPVLNVENTKRGFIDINVPTRDVTEINQIGVLYKTDIADDSRKQGDNTGTSVLPLYGKRKYRGSHKWIYYTYTDGYHNVRVPIYHKNKQCDKEIGCDELYENDLVTIPSLNGTYKVTIYENEELRYIPI